MNFLFLHYSRFATAPWRDGSTRYRCYHLAEALQELGHLADVAPLEHVDLKQLDCYDVVSVLRPQASRKLGRLIKHCKRLGIHLVADVDDLIFDEALAGISPSVINGQAAEAVIEHRFRNNAHTLQDFDEITVSTKAIADAWQQMKNNVPVTVVANGLSKKWLHAADLNLVHQGGKNDDRFRITYLPGTHSHDRDFESVIDVMASTLKRHSIAELLIVGKLNFSQNKIPEDRLIRASWMDYHYLPNVIASSDVTLAPLEDTPFTRAKSHIKFIESTAFDTPVICSPNEDITRHTTPGLLVAETKSDWLAAIESLINKHTNNRELSTTEHSKQTMLRDYARKHCLARSSASALLTHWSDIGLEQAFSHAA